jgi:hypothetical protein
VYDIAEETVRPAAQQRAVAMRLSDEWVEEGCHPASPLLSAERRTLVASYTALRDSIDRAALPR